eukprot:TRINITY_DN67580_c6_g7_i2.p1 TRINITY_DN67580_c6_g7~~TRINITY_DN67580_c6_g7_i2.p1  ORF type:complete len:196 (-),score=86.68 TRINITY_DN67580_c6_g7_i2:51-638(-)
MARPAAEMMEHFVTSPSRTLFSTLQREVFDIVGYREPPPVDDSLTAGEIAAIVIGCTFGAIAIAVVYVYLRRKEAREGELTSHEVFTLQRQQQQQRRQPQQSDAFHFRKVADMSSSDDSVVLEDDDEALDVLSKSHRTSSQRHVRTYDSDDDDDDDDDHDGDESDAPQPPSTVTPAGLFMPRLSVYQAAPTSDHQ